jgi:hypothetical protein
MLKSNQVINIIDCIKNPKIIVATNIPLSSEPALNTKFKKGIKTVRMESIDIIYFFLLVYFIMVFIIKPNTPITNKVAKI